ncbi:hypothetical protein AB0C34_27880 [Nocardia sp. NPDC049220]|uniref:hypothetical protein n=1 Tax=Nocardia sp. NPDC049220 TaxID=3155273 RepID=UPI0033F3289F
MDFLYKVHRNLAIEILFGEQSGIEPARPPVGPVEDRFRPRLSGDDGDVAELVLHEQADFECPVGVGPDPVRFFESTDLLLDGQVQKSIVSGRVRSVDRSLRTCAVLRVFAVGLAVRGFRKTDLADPGCVPLVFVLDPTETVSYRLRECMVCFRYFRAGFVTNRIGEAFGCLLHFRDDLADARPIHQGFLSL